MELEPEGMMMSEATPQRLRLAEAREARIHSPEVAAAHELFGQKVNPALRLA